VTISTSPQYITDRTGLESLCRTLHRSPRLALDTEFVGEESFVPRLELIQVATEQTAAIIDFPAVKPLDRSTPFGRLSVGPMSRRSFTQGGKISISLRHMPARFPNRF
jgi:hypothetical protein